jgi:hypothetical protein
MVSPEFKLETALGRGDPLTVCKHSEQFLHEPKTNPGRTYTMVSHGAHRVPEKTAGGAQNGHAVLTSRKGPDKMVLILVNLYGGQNS